LQAAENTGLKEPFLHITRLGDFSVSYRIAEFLEEVKHIVSIRSKLREQMLDQLHAYEIEIVSPNFMNQRVYQSDLSFIPKPLSRKNVEETDKAEIEIEKIIFDKADQAETIEKLEYNMKMIQEKINQLSEEVKRLMILAISKN
jgi:small conductance mechanosensitive channel